MSSTSPIDQAFLRSVGEHAAADGMRSLPGAELGALVDAGRHTAVSPVLLGVLSDPGEPEVARLRALSRLLVALERELTAGRPGDYLLVTG